MRKFIGLDVGDVRIGVAKCDPLGILATALEVIDRNKTEPISRIKEILDDESTKKVVVGLPKSLDGTKKRQVEKVEEFVEELKKEIQNMQDLTEKLLFLAKSKNLVVEKKSVNLDTILKETIDNLNFAYPDQLINYSSSEIFIDSDEALLRLLFKNLIENAIKYGNNSPVNVILEKGRKIKVIIEDFGLGISKEALPHIFERFYREDEARNREIKSYGLGLSIVKEILSLLDIDIQVDSELGKGTKITLEM